MAEFINPALVPKVTLPSGEEVPCVGMGTFGSDRVSAEDVSAAVAGAVRSGYRMFDCAACYGNEPQIGKVFKDAFDEGVVERKDLFIMTKVWNEMCIRDRPESAEVTGADNKKTEKSKEKEEPSVKKTENSAGENAQETSAKTVETSSGIPTPFLWIAAIAVGAAAGVLIYHFKKR